MKKVLCLLGIFIAVLNAEPHVNSLNMTLIPLSKGSYTMGSPETEKERGEDENQVKVILSGDFAISRTEVTQGQWSQVMKTSLEQQIKTQDGPVGRGAKLVAKASAEGENQPMCFVSWNDAMAFCKALTEFEREKGSLPEGMVYSLPTEAQWEYACRAGTETVFAYGDSLSSQQANFYGPSPYGGVEKGEYREKTVAVGSFPANAWGIHDMHGNVYEWCLDWYTDSLAGGEDPVVTTEAEARVIRGGTWNRKASSCRSAYRYSAYPYTRSYNIGFRVVLIPEVTE